MTEEVSTRRAIEICLSRLKMNDVARQALMYALSDEIAGRNAKPPAHDPDALLAIIFAADDALSGVSDFPRAGLLARISIAREMLQSAKKKPPP